MVERTQRKAYNFDMKNTIQELKENYNIPKDHAEMDIKFESPSIPSIFFSNNQGSEYKISAREIREYLEMTKLVSGWKIISIQIDEDKQKIIAYVELKE